MIAFATHKEELQSMYWDFYKEVYNVRPRWMNFKAMSEADLCEALDRLEEQAKSVFAQREAEQNAAITKFEKTVSETIAYGAGDRATAIRWLMYSDAGTKYDAEYFEYLNGLPCGYLNRTAV